MNVGTLFAWKNRMQKVQYQVTAVHIFSIILFSPAMAEQRVRMHVISGIPVRIVECIFFFIPQRILVKTNS